MVGKETKTPTSGTKRRAPSNNEERNKSARISPSHNVCVNPSSNQQPTIVGANIPILMGIDDEISGDEEAHMTVPPLPLPSGKERNCSGSEISELVKTLQENITNHIDVKLMEHKKEFGKQLEEIKDKVKGCMNEISFIKNSKSIDNNKQIKKILKSVSTCRKSTLNAKYDEELRDYEICFSPKNIYSVLLLSVINYLIKGVANWDSKLLEEAEKMNEFDKSCARVLKVLLFGRQVGKGKAVWEEGIGAEASILKYTVLVSLVVNMKQNRFDLFEVEGDDRCTVGARSHTNNSQSVCSAESVSTNRVIQFPTWLNPIREEHIEAVRCCREKKKKVIKETYKTNMNNHSYNNKLYNVFPAEEQICIRACERLFTDVTGEIHDGRGRSRLVFTEEIGYFLGLWNEISMDGCTLDKPKIVFGRNRKRVILDQSEVGCTDVDRLKPEALSNNEDKFRDISYNTSSYLTFFVSHDVFVQNCHERME